jgi:hypothetical protein
MPGLLLGLNDVRLEGAWTEWDKFLLWAEPVPRNSHHVLGVFDLPGPFLAVRSAVFHPFADLFCP